MLKYLRMGNKRTKTIWWALIVLTVISFIGGFIFLFGSGIGGGGGVVATGTVGTVNGTPIPRSDYQIALENAREGYRRQYNTTPADQDARMVEAQAWRNLVVQKLLGDEARRLGLRATDPEVVLTLQTSPPPMLAQSPSFQTDGKFDPEKYRAALMNPGNNWAPFEEMVRNELPLRKLQERLAASIKLSQPELQEALRNRFERIGFTAVHVAPDMSGTPPQVSDADIDRVFQKFKGRFASGPRTEAEVLTVPRVYTEEELRVAREMANGLAARARAGEDFAMLARDYSEGPGADRGGEIQRVFQPSEFGPQLAPRMAAMQKGDISDPIPESGRFIIVKVTDRITDPMSPTPNLRVSQIIVKAKASEESMREQYEKVKKIRDRAPRIGLGKAATEAGLATTKTAPFDVSNPPAQLYTVPEALDWSIGAKPKAVSPVYNGLDEFVVVQVTSQRAAGPAEKGEVVDQLRQLAEFEARSAKAKPKADQVAAALAQGQTLEDAGATAGVPSIKVEAMSRTQPDPRFGAAPEVIGALFAAPQGRVVGPIQSPTGWYFARVDSRAPLDTALFNNPQIKGQITTEILSRKQNEFFSAWVAERRAKAQVKDLRQP